MSRSVCCLGIYGFAILAASVVFLAAAKPGPPPGPPPGVSLDANLAYDTEGGQSLKLDITRPAKGDGPFPTLVMVHGGGWVGGDKESMRPLMYGLAAKGIAGASVEYRLAPKARFPAQVQDAACAIRWLRANAAAYHIDKKRIGPLDKEPARYREASPITYADAGTVPALLTAGTSDTLVPIEQPDLFCAKLKKAGVDVELIRIEAAGHADFGKDPNAVLRRLTEFLARRLVHPSGAKSANPSEQSQGRL
ncbi:MAG TPA: alpha/beta hydrolase [Chthonomonadaceae bacterium]|nr:alpha/beta hydrolase [Chthonomonadaceae bacterium]